MIRIVLVLAAYSFGLDIVTTWPAHNIQLKYPSTATLSETTTDIDSIYKQKSFELKLQGRQTPIKIIFGTKQTIKYAEREVSFLNSWNTAVAFRNRGQSETPPSIYNYQDSSADHITREGDTWITNTKRLAFSDIVVANLDAFSYSESNNQFFYGYRFALPLSDSVDENLHLYASIMSGLGFIDQNLGGLRDPVSIQGVRKSAVPPIGRRLLFDALGRKAAGRPPKSPQKTLIFRR